jgi:hypothetical protein
MKSKFMHNTVRGISVLPILFIVMAIAVAGAIGYAMSTQTDLFLSRGDNTNIVGCTLEAKVCPDGSSVGRIGSNCAFADCPATNTNTSTDTNTAMNTNTTVNTNTAIDPKADWKTYTSAQYGYSLKYPKEWVVVSMDRLTGAEKSDGTRTVFWSKTNYKQLIPEATEWIPTADLYQFVVTYADPSREENLADKNITLLSSTAVTVDGITGTKDVFRGPFGDWTMVYVKKNGIVYSLQLPSFNDSQKALADTIMSTFTFTK